MIYILQFNQPLGNPANPKGMARFYVGWCEKRRFDERMQEHLTGNGAKITQWAVSQGIGWTVVLTMPGDRGVERWIKDYGNTPLLIERYRRGTLHIGSKAKRRTRKRP